MRDIKLPKARRLSSGNWFIQLRLNGESIPITETTARKCEALARSIKAQYKVNKQNNTIAKTNNANNALTLKQAIDNYIESRDNVLSPSTVRGYNMIRDHRFKDIMNKPITEIGNWQDVCNTEIRLCSAKTLKNAWGLISSALVFNGYAIPKLTLPQIVLKENAWLDPEQIKVFLKAIKGDICECQILLALHGLRRSELCAISSWDKIDLKANRIFVHGAIVPGKDNTLVNKEENKNSYSRRDLPIMIPRLKVLLLNKKKKDEPIISAHPNTILRHINNICKSNKLPEVGMQGLRRSFASLCYHVGLSEQETMFLGGWGDAHTMRKIYIHLAQQDKKKAENKVANFFKAQTLEHSS